MLAGAATDFALQLFIGERHAAQGHDEGRHAEIGDDGPLQQSDGRAVGQSDSQGNDPDERMLEAEIFRQELGLRHAHDHADQAEDGADREVDMARHDHQHHAGRHDGDRRGLHREVPQVAWRQEGAAGQEVDPDPDQRQRAQHADQPRVYLGGTKQVGKAAPLGHGHTF